MEPKDIIKNSQNIKLITENPEWSACALALFYTLRELGKNVNLSAVGIPKFLLPNTDYILSPKELVISVPGNIDVSQISYEKNKEELKIYIETRDGVLKKNALSFSFADLKEDTLITIKESAIETKQGNDRMSIEGKPLPELTFDFISSINGGIITKEVATSLMAQIIMSGGSKEGISSRTMEISAVLMKNGANQREIIDNFYK